MPVTVLISTNCDMQNSAFLVVLLNLVDVYICKFEF